MEFNDDSIRAVFEGLKKKKKRVVKATSDQEQEEFDNEQGFGKKKKKKPVEIKAPLQTTQWSTADYTYKELLDRVFAVLRQNNQDVSGESRFNILIRSYKIVPPQIMREGTKKTAFANILDISTRMNRRPDHVIQFLFTELGTSGSIDGSQRLIIKGRY
jgi:translation initiation factor 2 subunit 2